MRNWIMDIEALDGQGTPVVLRYSDGEVISEYFYEPRLKQPGIFQEGLFSNNILPSERSSFGVTQLINSDGFLNNLVEYAIDGRRVTLSLFENGNTTELFTGIAQRFEFDRNLVNLRLRDPVEVLNIRRNFNTYAGDNILPDGLEGTQQDLKGNPKPRLYGEVEQFTPTLVNSAKLIYQISDQNCVVTDVFDSGNPLGFDGEYNSLVELETIPPNQEDWDAWIPPAGTYRRYQGYIRLGTEPVGRLTVNASTNNATLSEVFTKIADEAGVGMSSLGGLNATGNVRLIATQEETYTSMLDRLAASAGSYWRRLPDGNIEAGLIPTPSTPTFTIYDYMILSISRSANGAGGNGIPVYRVDVNADRIETVQDDLAGNVSESFKARVSKQWRNENRESSTTLARHPLSEQFTINSDLSSLSDAADVAQRVLDIMSVRRDSVDVTINLSTDTASLPLLSTVRLETSRLGYSQGRDMLVVQKTYNPVKNRVSLKLFG